MAQSVKLIRRKQRLKVDKLTLSIDHDILADFRLKFPDVNISATVELMLEECIKNAI